MCQLQLRVLQGSSSQTYLRIVMIAIEKKQGFHNNHMQYDSYNHSAKWRSLALIWCEVNKKVVKVVKGDKAVHTSRVPGEI